MDTFGLVRDTQSPFSLKSLFSWKRLMRVLRSKRGEAGAEDTFTKEQVAEQVATAVAAAKSGAGPFYDGFAPDIKGHPDITRYKSVEEMAKGHIEQGKTIGLKGVLVPSEGSSDKVKNDFAKATGRPDEAGGYSKPLFDNLHEGVKAITDVDIKAFNDKAFALGLSSKQHQGILEWHLGLSSQRLTEYDKTVKDEKDTAATGLRNKWGGNYEAKLALANGLVKKFGSEALMAEVGDSPEMIELLANLGGLISEDNLGELGGSTLGMTPEQAKQEISKVTQQIMETKQDDPIYGELLKKKDNLYKIAYPSAKTQ